MKTRTEMTLFRLWTLCLLGLLLVSMPASATLYDMTRITSNGAGLVFDAGDFTMDVAAQAGGALITFSNNCSLDSVVTAICFLENDMLEFKDFAPSPVTSEGLAFSVVTKNAMLPGGKPYGFTPHSAFAVDADPAGPKNGLSSGTSLGLQFDLVNGATFDTLISAFNQQSLIAGIHVQALPGEFSETFVNTVPEPLTLSLLGIGTLLIRHKKRGTAQ